MDRQLLAAVENGNEAELDNITSHLPAAETRRLLEQRVTPEGDGLLHIAARFGRHNIVWPLFDIATNVAPAGQPWWRADFWRAKNSSGQTSLHEAIRHGRAEFVQQLLTNDDMLLLHDDRRRPLALVQMDDDEGMSPLYMATTMHRLDIITTLVHPARVHPASYGGPQGRTAMHAAVVTNSLDICRQLLDWNDLDRDLIRRADETGSTPLHYLASSCNIADIAPLLLTAADIRDEGGSLPIHVAAGQGRLDIIKLLLEERPDSVRARNSSGQTFLHVAAHKESNSVVAYICKQHSRMFTTILNARDDNGNTALHLTVLTGDHFTFLHLLRKGEFDLNITNKDGHTPLDLLFLSGKVHDDIMQIEGHFVPSLAISSGQYKIRYLQNRHDWMAYDLILAGASRGARRWDHFATQLPQIQDTDREWDKVGKSASVLAVSAGLILNAAIALPFNVAARYNEQEQKIHSPRRTLAFRGFLASDAVAFLSSGVATFCCTYSGFAAVGKWRFIFLYYGAGCLIAASLACYGLMGMGFLYFGPARLAGP